MAEAKTKKTTRKVKATPKAKKKQPYLNKYDWALVFSLLINLKLDQIIIVNYQKLLNLILQRKYTPEYLETLTDAQFESLNQFIPKLAEFTTLGLGFLLPAIALLLAVWARKNTTSPVLAATSIIISIIIMSISVISAIGYIMQLA